MSYEQFISAMMERAETKAGKDVVVERQTVVKNNGVAAVGIVIRREGEQIAPVLYMEELYDRYRQGESMERLSEIVMQAFLSCPAPPKLDLGELLDYERARGQIAYKLVNARRNEELLAQIPHLPVFDLAIVFYLIVSQEAFQNCSVLIRNDHMKLWDVTMIDLYRAAKENTPKLCPYTLRSLLELLGEEYEEISSRILVLSNEQGINGAAAFFYPDVLKLAARRVRGNYYLIPSSVHEMLIVPEEEGIGAESLAAIVREINGTEVSEEDVLSDSVYYFDGEHMAMCGGEE